MRLHARFELVSFLDRFGLGSSVPSSCFLDVADGVGRFTGGGLDNLTSEDN